jgi:hypothetical protein
MTPTPVVFPPPRFGEPELICPYFSDIQPGYNWNGIIIGVSVQDDLESVLEQIGRYEMVLPVEGALANSIGYKWRDSREEGIVRQAPAQIDVCFQDSKVVVLDMTWFYQPAFYINDLAESIGEPDIITWSLSENLRLAFWFELGIAGEIFVQRGDSASFGQLTRIIYFPPQSVEGYDGRWTFNLTRTQPFVPSDPSIPSEQNPFDFNAMIATITAEPSRTPTPTFAPQAVEATATP